MDHPCRVISVRIVARTSGAFAQWWTGVTKCASRATMLLPETLVDSEHGLFERRFDEVSILQIKPDACIQVTSKCMRGGWKSPPVNRLSFVPPGEAGKLPGGRMKNDVIVVAETKRLHPFHDETCTDEELFLGTCVEVSTALLTSPKRV
ncbi:hypothetical protein KIN20_031389 [Parelaphostrongylus tenuis]|uniref:Uncharacterized protein n=1 Tax=Parelaphostrongylus tenuis TaxID=148309 RepID=A0AAD5R5I0_PARTN|nr:hypothetical protein KIN20_031389 [Parelaphostrongylus tenuis]